MKKIFVILMLLATMSAVSETINVSKAGKLKKELKKQRLQDVSTLKISGEINQKDFNELENLSTLSYLDFSNASFKMNKSQEKDNLIVLPTIPSLKTLIIPDFFPKHMTIDLSRISNVRYLKASRANDYIGYGSDVIDTLELVTSNSDINGSFDGSMTVKSLILDTESYDISRIIPQGRVLSIHINRKSGLDKTLIAYSNEYPDVLLECNRLGTLSLQDYPLTDFTVPSNIDWIDNNAFKDGNIKNIIFISGSPLFSDIIDHNSTMDIAGQITILVPVGTIEKYKRYIKNPIYEMGKTHSYTFHSDREGSLRSFLTQDIILDVDTLRIVGQVDYVDLESIKGANNLRVLNLENCDIIKPISKIDTEIYNLVKEYVEKINMVTIENLQKALDDYNGRVGLGSLLLMCTDIADEIYGAEAQTGDIEGKFKQDINGAINREIRQAMRDLPPMSAETNRIIRWYEDALFEISQYYKRLPEIIDELKGINYNEWETIKDSNSLINSLEENISSDFWAKGYSSKFNIPGMLSERDHINDYKLVWDRVNPHKFTLYKKRKKINRDIEYVSDLEIQLRNRLYEFSVFEEKAPAYFNNLENLNKLILNPRLKVESIDKNKTHIEVRVGS